eukprot:Pgem_evm1s3305
MSVTTLECNVSQNEEKEKKKKVKRLSLSSLKLRGTRALSMSTRSSSLSSSPSSSSLGSTSLDSLEFKNEQKLEKIDRNNLEQDPLLFMFYSKNTINLLKQFLDHEFNGENINFVSAVLEYEAETDENKRFKLATLIYTRFVHSKAKEQVNLSQKQVEEIESNLNSGDIDLFDNSKKHAITMMKLNSFPRFGDKITELVRESWARISKAFNAQTVGDIFYEQLFTTAPDLKLLFLRSSPHMQSTMFVSMIDNAITIMDDLTLLIPKLASLSQRHRDYGCHTGHFGLCGEVLVKVLKIAEGENWNEELEQAWLCTYTLISTVMKEFLPDPPKDTKINVCTL